MVGQNGRLDQTLLSFIDGVYLDPTTARAWSAMRAACKAATGVELDIVNYWGGYRTFAQQVSLAQNPPSGISVAAAGSSKHGLGHAVDITTPTRTAAQRWLDANRAIYGFAASPKNDPNHFQHNGITTGAGTMATAGEIAAAVWRGIFVKRNGQEVPALQELADIRSDTMQIRADTAALLTIARNPVAAAPPISDAQLDTLAAKLAPLIAAKIAVPTKGTITLTN